MGAVKIIAGRPVRHRTLTEFHREQKRFSGSGADFAAGILIAFLIICVIVAL